MGQPLGKIGKGANKDKLPMITNSTNSTNGGYGVILADKTKIQHIHVLGTESSGIYGEDVDKVTVQNNELSGFNTAVHIFPRFGGVFNFR